MHRRRERLLQKNHALAPAQFILDRLARLARHQDHRAIRPLPQDSEGTKNLTPGIVQEKINITRLAAQQQNVAYVNQNPFCRLISAQLKNLPGARQWAGIRRVRHNSASGGAGHHRRTQPHLKLNEKRYRAGTGVNSRLDTTRSIMPYSSACSGSMM